MFLALSHDLPRGRLMTSVGPRPPGKGGDGGNGGSPHQQQQQPRPIIATWQGVHYSHLGVNGGG